MGDGKNSVVPSTKVYELNGKASVGICGCCCTQRRRKRRIRRFYEEQESLREKFEEDELLIKNLETRMRGSVCEDVEYQADIDARKRRMDSILSQISFWLNVLLLTLKGIIAYLSNSMSIISSLVDSAVDIASIVVIWVTARKMANFNPYLFPRGRSKLEPLAVIIVSVIMGTASIEVMIQAVMQVTSHKVDPKVEIPTISVMATAIAIKLVLMVVCYRQNTSSTLVLATDHRNDCVANTVAIICAYLGSRYWKFIDPIGAILVSLYILVTWFFTGAEQIPLLSGKRADKETVNRIINLCIKHDERIIALETLFVYHYGTKFLVEAHVLMDEHTPLRLSHDLCEKLQMKLEHLPYVERAFIHTDYGFDSDKCPCGMEH